MNMQQVRTWRAGEHVVIGLAGELDQFVVPHVRPVLVDAVEENRPPQVIVDLREVEFCDSSGLGLLVGAYKRATAAGGSLVLAGAGPRVADVLSVTGLDRVLETYHRVEDAAWSYPASSSSEDGRLGQLRRPTPFHRAL